LVEREAELERLATMPGETQAGDGTLMLIEGPAGIGKSRLLDAVAGRAEAAGLEVLRARGGSLERDFAYGVVRQLLERRVTEAADEERQTLLAGPAELASPALGLAGGGESLAAEVSFPVIHGLYWLVDNLSAQSPVLLVVDDAHWSDPSSLRFLLYLAARLEGSKVSLIAALRPPEPATETTLMRQFRAAAPASTLRPQPLTHDGVASMISGRLAGEPTAEFIGTCRDATGGNPFLLSELLSALAADGVGPSALGSSRVRELGPETVSRSILLRLAQLDAGAGGLARAVAVLGAAAELDDAAELAGADDPVAAADALAAIEILAPGRPLTFLHPILREAVYADIAELEREQMHDRAAVVLRRRGAGTEEIAPHLLIARPSGNPETVSILREAAAGALRQGAADAAQRLLRRALVEPPGDDELADVLEELGFAEWLAGEDLVGSIEHLEQAVAMTSDPASHARRAVLLARAIFSTGDAPRAARVLKHHLAQLEGAEGDEIVRLAAEYGSVGILQPPLIERDKARLEKLMDLADPTPAQLLHLSNLSTWHWLDGTAADTIRTATASLGDGRLLASEGADSFPIYQSAYVLSFADEHDLAWETLEGTLADARARGSVFGFTSSSAVRAIVCWHRGDVAACEAEARNGVALGALPPIVRGTIFTYLALALVARGELDEAEWAVTESGCGPYLPDLVHFNQAFYARARLRLAQGKVEEALEDALELGRRDARLEIRNPGVPWRTAAVDALVAMGDREQARQYAREHRQAAESWGTRSAIGVAVHAEGVASQDEALLEHAIDLLSATPALLATARALVDLGGARRRAGRRKEAREPLREGLELARQCGATALVETAHAELVTAGARPRRLQFSGLESLTASERRVATMAAEGMSNKEIAQALFVTVKTVETHLSRVYSKLDIGSRGELAQALADG
jgi:DNA-binding CsgD family transcriptional regulator